MFLPAFFGLGLQEIILLAGLAVIPLVVAVILVSRSSGGGRASALEEENRRLRDENDRLRGDR